MLVALVPEAGEVPNDHAVDNREVKREDVVEGEAHDRVLLFFSFRISNDD